MPAVLNIAANLFLGALLPLLTRNSQALREEFLSWQLLFLTAFEAVIFTPVATYLFRFHPQWSTLYAFDPQLFPNFESWAGWLSAVAIILNFGAVIAGFSLARWGLLRQKKWAVLAPSVAGAIVWFGVMTLCYDRVFFIGDFDDFWQGNADHLLKAQAGWVGLFSYAGSAGFLVWVHRHFRSHDPTLL